MSVFYAVIVNWKIVDDLIIIHADDFEQAEEILILKYKNNGSEIGRKEKDGTFKCFTGWSYTIFIGNPIQCLSK